MDISNSLKRKSNVLEPTLHKRPKVFTKVVPPGTSARDSSPSEAPITPPVSPVVHTRDTAYYFADGDIIVESGTTLFRVHVDRLVKLKGIFEDLLSLPQSANLEDAGYIDGLPVCPLFNTVPSDVRFLMAYAYGEVALKTEVPGEPDKLHWNATVALLHLSHMFDLVAVRNTAINAMKSLFPCTLMLPTIYPTIIGVRRRDRGLFLRTIPLQAINLFRQYNLQALMPMAYYRAAQLSIADIVGGVLCSDCSRVTISAHDIVRVLEGREQLKHDCPNTPDSLGDTCLDFLLKMVVDFNRTSFMDSRTDALETLPQHSEAIFARNLCGSCFHELYQHLIFGQDKNWVMLPTYFGFKSWEEVLDAQRLEDERYDWCL
ncbi:hypothetical protein FPV67DRAFT_1487047 [Lyophyllum atratum]|nr:hypothetical protein FPV67DRAFT_1487047 [Lyophyllum atratum]